MTPGQMFSAADGIAAFVAFLSASFFLYQSH
jgi:hypothetical protein